METRFALLLIFLAVFVTGVVSGVVCVGIAVPFKFHGQACGGARLCISVLLLLTSALLRMAFDCCCSVDCCVFSSGERCVNVVVDLLTSDNRCWVSSQDDGLYGEPGSEVSSLDAALESVQLNVATPLNNKKNKM